MPANREHQRRSIVTQQDTPVLLPHGLGIAAGFFNAGSTQSVVRIGDCDLFDARPTDLPGIRVGDGRGCGYLLCREIDGRLVFVPDAGYAGEILLSYAVDDGNGSRDTHIVSVVVQPFGEVPSIITFANGSQAVDVPEGVDNAILGALSIDGLAISSVHDIFIFESESEQPSHRFTVTGDKLRLLQPLVSAVDETVRLRVVAFEDDLKIAVDELKIAVHPAGAFDPAKFDRFEYKGYGNDRLHVVDPESNEHDLTVWPDDRRKQQAVDALAQSITEAGELNDDPSYPDNPIDLFGL